MLFFYLQAVYSVSTMDSFYITLRVMEVMLNLVDTLMEIGVHKNWQINQMEEPPTGGVDPLIDFSKDRDNKVYKIFYTYRCSI